MTPTTAETIEEIKARGAFYTPDQLTRFLAKWAVRSPDDRVLEPSCGDGAFVAALVERFTALGGISLRDRLLGVERNPVEAEKARSLAPGADIRTLDFFELEPAAVPRVDAAIGNPPYIRYHGFTGPDRHKALLRAQAQGVELTRLASSWAHFLVHAAAFLKSTGRLAMVLPAELLHADYGRPVREFLLRRFQTVIVIAFDRMVFREAQVDAVLLLASNDGATGLRVIRVHDESALEDLEIGALPSNGNGHASGRWSSAVHVDARDAYEQAIAKYGPTRLGEMASVDIGFVTGANDFFVLASSEARQRGVPRRLLTPAIRRPRDVPGLVVRPEELSWLLDLSGRDVLHPAVRQYLAEGEAKGVSQRYKCRVRRPWYTVPMPRQQPDAFMPYMAHLGPRLIVNEVGAKSTNLLHGVSLHAGAPPARALAVAMCSSLTHLSAEIEGRTYGGGVLKLETREAERLALPAFEAGQEAAFMAMFQDIDRLVRSGEAEAASREVDRILSVDHDTLREAYLEFRARRLGRRGRVR